MMTTKIREQFPKEPTFVERLDALPSALKKTVIGQPDGVFAAIADTIRKALADPNAKTLGEVLITGPAASGKTFLARETAKHLGMEPVVIDGSFLHEEGAAARLIGIPPQYVGTNDGLLGELSSVHFALIFDEIEKASVDVYRDVLLPIIMEGEIEARGTHKKVSFKNAPVFLITDEKNIARVAAKMTAALVEYKKMRQERGLETGDLPLLSVLTRAASLPSSPPDEAAMQGQHAAIAPLSKETIAKILKFHNEEFIRRVKDKGGHAVEISDDAITQYVAAAPESWGVRTASQFQINLAQCLIEALNLNSKTREPPKPMLINISGYTPGKGLTAEVKPAPVANAPHPPTQG